MAIWMAASATKYQIVQVGTKLTSSDLVHACSYRTRREDYREAERLLPKSEFSALTFETTPTKYICVLDGKDMQKVSDRFRLMGGVLQVTYAEHIVEK
ncbi:MAG: hypothetical protein ACRDYB_05720 [Acidimicrobiales bacterium]